jgi:hypothetical protein
VTVCGGHGDAQYFRGFFGGHPDKIPELDQFGFLLVLGGQLFQSLTHRDNLILVLSELASDFGDLNSLDMAVAKSV